MIFFIRGEDDYLADLRKKELKDKAAAAARECENFRADENPAAQIADAALNMSLFAAAKTVFIDNLDKAPKKSLEELAEKLAPPPEGLDIVFVWRGKPKSSERTGALGKILAIARVFEEKPPRGRAIAAWAQNEAKRFGKILRSDAADFLSQETGRDMRTLAGEIEKCATAAGVKKEITLADAAEHLFEKSGGNIFEFAGALEKKDLKKSMRSLDRLMAEGTEPLVILDRIHKTYSRIYRGKMLKAAGLGTAEISGKLLLSSYYDGDFFKNAAGYSDDEVAEAIALTSKCNLKLKRTSRAADKKSVLAALVAEILN